MPVRTKRPFREGGGNLTAFSGSRAELDDIDPLSVRAHLEKAGVKFESDRQAGKILHDMKGKVVGKVNELSATGNRDGLLAVDMPGGEVMLKVTLFGDDGVRVIQHPAQHGIQVSGVDVHLGEYKTLKRILEGGFFGRKPESPGFEGYKNVSFDGERHKASWATRETAPGITQGDGYSLELMAPIDKDTMKKGFGERFQGYLSNAHPNEIVRVNILLNTYATEAELAEKRRHYKKELRGWPLTFIEPKK